MSTLLISKKHLYSCLAGAFLALTAFSARADICFIPAEECSGGSTDALKRECAENYSLSAKKTGDNWECDECGGKYWCYCKSGYTEQSGKCVYDQTHDTCPINVYSYTADLGEGYSCEKCDDKSSAQYGKYKCEDGSSKCKSAGYTYVKTANNTCAGGDNKCPYGDYYKVCTCNGYDETDNSDKCYAFTQCDLGDGKTTKYKKGTSQKKCTDSTYVSEDNDMVKDDNYDCSLKCTETCENNKKYYVCKKKDSACANGPYSWRDTECCAKDEWKNTKYCQKPACTITAGGKQFSDPISPYSVADFVPTQCSDRLKQGLGISNLQYACYSSGTNYVLGMIRYCGGINDFAGLDDWNTLATAMYGRTITNNASAGVYNRCEIPAPGLPKYDNVSVSNSSIYSKISASSTYYVRECYNGGEAGYLSVTDKIYGVNYAPVPTSNRSGYGLCVCSDGDCTGCDYCIAGTCKSSGENRIISDSSTYEACGSGCNGKYRCKAGYTPQYAGSNQYKCIPSGCYYDSVAQCKAAGYTYTAAERWEIEEGTNGGRGAIGECEPCNCNGTEMNRCVLFDNCENQFEQQCTSWGGTLKSSSSSVSEDVCHAVFGECDGKYWYCLKPGCSDDKVTVYYDAPTDCNPILMATNSSNGQNTPLAATNQMDPGRYTFNFSSGGNGTGSSFTIRMGRGGTPTTYSSGSGYTFYLGNEYWIVPSCSNGGGGSGGGSSTYNCSYPVVCSEAGGTWNGNHNCSIKCYIWGFKYTNYTCEQSSSGTWSVKRTRKNYCLDDETGQVYKNLEVEDQSLGTYSTRTGCEQAMTSQSTSDSQKQSNYESQYPEYAHHSGYMLADRYCKNW